MLRLKFQPKLYHQIKKRTLNTSVCKFQQAANTKSTTTKFTKKDEEKLNKWQKQALEKTRKYRQHKKDEYLRDLYDQRSLLASEFESGDRSDSSSNEMMPICVG